MAFSNVGIAPVRQDKPHIVARDGWWRVSPFPKQFYGDVQVNGRFNQAYKHVDRMNHPLSQYRIYNVECPIKIESISCEEFIRRGGLSRWGIS